MPRLSDSREFEHNLWFNNGETIRQLYQGDNGPGKTLKELKRVLEDEHGFPTFPLSTYEANIRALGCRKKLRRDEWLSVWLHFRRVQQDYGGYPAIYLNGTLIPQAKVAKEFNRNRVRRVPIPSRLPELPGDVMILGCTGPATRGSAVDLIEGFQSEEELCVDSFWDTWKAGWLRDLPWLNFVSTLSGMEMQDVGGRLRPFRSSHQRQHKMTRSLFTWNPSSVQTELFRVHHDEMHHSSALALDFDPIHTLAKAALRFSNALVYVHSPSKEDRALYIIVTKRISKTLLGTFLGSALPSARATGLHLMEFARRFNDQATFGFICSVNEGSLQRIFMTEPAFLVAAARFGLLDVCQSTLLASPTTSGTMDFVTRAIVEASSKGHFSCAKALIAKVDTNERDNDGSSIFNRFFISFEPADCGDSSYLHVLEIFLEHGANVDAVISGDINDLPVDTFSNCHGPAPFDNLTTLECAYYLQRPGLPTMRTYSKSPHRGVSRQGIWEAASAGVSSLHDYMLNVTTSFTEVAPGFAFLELVLAEQFLQELRVPDWQIVSVLLNYGVSPSFPHTGTMCLDDFLCCILTAMRRFGSISSSLDCLHQTLQAGASFSSYAIAAAVEATGSELVQIIADSGAPIDILGSRALAQAARWDNHTAIWWLLDNGADIHGIVEVNQTGPPNQQTISFAAAAPCGRQSSLPQSNRSKLTVAEWLYRDLSGDPASISTMQFLVDHGARLRQHPNDLDAFPFLDSVIATGVRRSHRDRSRLGLVKLICESGISFQHSKAPCVLERAAWQREWDVYAYLLGQGAPVSPGSPLACLILAGAPIALIEATFAAGARFNDGISIADFGTQGLTPIAAAAQRWDVGLMRRMISCGGLLHPPSCSMIDAPLLRACNRNTLSAGEAAGQIEAVRYLLSTNSTTGCPCAMKLADEALLSASWHGNIELVLILLDNGSNCNAQAPPVTSPDYQIYRYEGLALDRAARRGHLDVVQLLLNAGGVSIVQDHTPFDGAIDRAMNVLESSEYRYTEVGRLIAREAVRQGYTLSERHRWLLQGE